MEGKWAHLNTCIVFIFLLLPLPTRFVVVVVVFLVVVVVVVVVSGGDTSLSPSLFKLTCCPLAIQVGIHCLDFRLTTVSLLHNTYSLHAESARLPQLRRLSRTTPPPTAPSRSCLGLGRRPGPRKNNSEDETTRGEELDIGHITNTSIALEQCSYT